LPFGAVDVNFKDMREKGYRKEKKNLIATQSNLLCEHASYHWKEDDSLLPTPQ
jgi:hypothetical protein